MITQHHHRAGEFDAGHCWACAHQVGLLDHDHRVQWEDCPQRPRQAAQWSAWQAAGGAFWWLCSSGILLVAIALLANQPASRM